MRIQLERHEIIYGDGTQVHRDLYLPRELLLDFLDEFMKHMFNLGGNRNCHRCTSSCGHALTMHIGRPFHGIFKECVPR